MGKLAKIRKLTLDELRVRASQAFQEFAEIRGWSSLTRLPTDQELLRLIDFSTVGRELWSAEELLEHFRLRDKPAFFQGFTDRNVANNEFRTRWPLQAEATIERANDITRGRFCFFGIRELSFGDPIDWHFDPASGKSNAIVHWSKLAYLPAAVAGDRKLVWELNRHQYFATLGQAYWLTGDERYAETFVSHLESWIQQNPPSLGINWASSLEVSFRSISWLWALYFFKDAKALTSRTFIKALKILYLNARHIESFLSLYFSPNTHLTGEALGLFYLGLLLPEFKESARWLDTGREILLKELPRHVRGDGVYFEQSSYYHRYTTDFYAHFLILGRLNGIVIPNYVEDKLVALLDHLMYITRPDGTTPFFGDDDGGRLVMLDQKPANDFRATLATGAALFERRDYKFVSGEAAVESLWLLGAEGLERFDMIAAREPANESMAFKEGGYYVMRDGWTADSNYLLFDCGPHGTGNCGHAHADALSIDLAARGRTLLVDPGTYTYAGSRELRDWFRSSLAHNTVTAGGRSSSTSAGPFSWQTIATCEPLAWITHDRFDYIAGKHDGYTRETQPTQHNRSILFLKDDYWIVRDQLDSSAEAEIDVRFHFDPAANPLIEAAQDQAFIAEMKGDSGLDVVAFGKNGRWTREESWVSYCYSQKEPSRLYAFSVVLRNGEVVSFLLPRTGKTRWQVREIEAVGGLAFELTNGKRLDIVMIRHAERVETARLAADFEWTWARFSPEVASLPDEVLLLNGRTLQVQGREVLNAQASLGYLTATRIESEYRIDSDSTNVGTAFSSLSTLRTERTES